MSAISRAAVRRFSSATQHFPGIGKIKYEGASSTNPLAFKHYNADEMIMGKVSTRPASVAECQ